MLRIAHIISGIDARNGGPTVALLGLAKAQREAGLDARVVATWREPTGPANAPVFEQAGVPLRLIGRAMGPLSWHPQLARMCREEAGAADVVHIHGVWEEIQHAAAAGARSAGGSGGLGVPYLYTAHGMLSEWSVGRRAWRKRFFLALRVKKDLDRAAAIHFTTVAERDSAVGLGIRAPALVETLGIDLSEFATPIERGALRSWYPQIGGRKIVMFLGRLSQEKGLDLLVPAFAKATNADEAVLVLAGPDFAGYEAEVRRMVAANGLTERVIFTGMLPGRKRLEALADADLLAQTSYTENFGVAVVEALASGVPVLITDQVRVKDFLSDADVGAIVPVGVEPIAAALRQWLRDDTLRRAAGGRGPALVRERFDLAAVARRWEGHYRRLIDTHRGRNGGRAS